MSCAVLLCIGLFFDIHGRFSIRLAGLGISLIGAAWVFVRVFTGIPADCTREGSDKKGQELSCRLFPLRGGFSQVNVYILCGV